MPQTALETPDDWALQAARLPIAFSQVREDPWIDQALVAELPPDAQILMIASGGDTAAFLAAQDGVGSVQLVDINPAQIALARLKLHLLEHCPVQERLALLGHAPMPALQRAAEVGALMEELQIAPDLFGPSELVARLGPDHCGRYELLFAKLREHLDPQEIADLLSLSDPLEQARRIASPTPLGHALDSALDRVMRLENLVCLFGQEATRNPCQDFPRHFAGRIRHAFANGPARTNPFLAQMLAGRFIAGETYPWMQVVPRLRLSRIECNCMTAMEALAQAPGESLDLIHLSNILDWLTAEVAASTLGLAWKALKNGGVLVLRQLNSTLHIQGLEPRFQWRNEQAATLHRHDRSFFYSALHIGGKTP